MSVNIDSIKRKLLIKYPTFGSTIANLEFQEMEEVGTAATDGEVLLYNPNFVDKLSDKEKVSLFAHEICHVAFDHIFRSEGKDANIWNTATDAVINAQLKQDGLPLLEGTVDIPDAINYDAEEMYNKLVKEREEKQEQDNKNCKEGCNNGDDNNQQQGSQGGQGGQNAEGSQEGQGKQDEENNVGYDDHSLWEKAIEERKRQEQDKDKSDNENKEKQNDTNTEKQQMNELVQKGEKQSFRENKEERSRQLQELSEDLAKMSSYGNGIQREGRKLTDIGMAMPLIDWRRLLKQAVRYEEEWSRKNARSRDGFFRHRIEQIPVPETEIVLDTSGSVSEILLRNFLRECKNILENSKVKVGCFNTEFHGFTELRRVEDIDSMEFPIGGGTDFNAAVEAFSQRIPNKIIFTDGEAPMPKKEVRNAIWVVFGDREIKPKGGKVINIRGEQLKRLYRENDKDRGLSR